MSRATAATATLAMALALVLLGGCGVPVESRPRPLDLPAGSGSATAFPAASPSGLNIETLYFVKDGMLAKANRRVDAERSAAELMRDLLSGPDDAERASGVTSALLGTTMVDSVAVADGIATVELASGHNTSGRTDDVLAFAQIVCTMARHDGIRAVVFVRAGKRIGVPRGDASVTSEPVSTADYINLISS